MTRRRRACGRPDDQSTSRPTPTRSRATYGDVETRSARCQRPIRGDPFSFHQNPIGWADEFTTQQCRAKNLHSVSLFFVGTVGVAT